jgi:hypothetical protein
MSFTDNIYIKNYPNIVSLSSKNTLYKMSDNNSSDSSFDDESI